MHIEGAVGRVFWVSNSNSNSEVGVQCLGGAVGCGPQHMSNLNQSLGVTVEERHSNSNLNVQVNFGFRSGVSCDPITT